MGYSEVRCHLCGVSFNIGRIRTAQEPRTAAWSIYALPTGRENSFVDGTYPECSHDSGCMFAIRKEADQNMKYGVDSKGRKILTGPKKVEAVEKAVIAIRGTHGPNCLCVLDSVVEPDQIDDPDDEGWVPEEEEAEDDEPLEYLSDEDAVMEDVEESSDDGMADSESGASEREALREFWIEALLKDEDGRKNLYKENNDGLAAWYQGPPSWAAPLLDSPVQDEMYPLYASLESKEQQEDRHGFADSEDAPEEDELRNADSCYGTIGYRAETSESFYSRASEVEHIAGPKCVNKNGYSGYQISAEEMRGCQTAQCLVAKLGHGPESDVETFETFAPLPDDEDFEKEGNFFLSGLTDHVPSVDIDDPQVCPGRHGCSQPQPSGYGDTYAMPFHPPCFEIFKRASQLARGRVNINALVEWSSRDNTNWGTRAFDRDPDVIRCRDQWWQHEHGTAYLVANPLFIPGFSDILHEAVDMSPGFSPRRRAFQPLGPGPANDPFNLLPVELQFKILDLLPSKDIASLRLCSRVFSDLPISYFQKLILREMPWLWEAWPTIANPTPLVPYSSWATMTAHEATLKLREYEKEMAKLTDYMNIMKQEYPELEEQVDSELSLRMEELQQAAELAMITDEKDRTPFVLPPDKTNYYTLYTLITRHWSRLLGLQNRKRIWVDCGHILSRIEERGYDALP